MQSEYQFKPRKLSWGLRVVAYVLLLTQALPTGPVLLLAADSDGQDQIPQGPAPVTTPKNVQVRKGSRDFKPFKSRLEFSDDPTDAEISSARVFAEPLVPMSSPAISGENLALAQALKDFKEAHDAENIGALTRFIQAYPNSRWNAALNLNIGSLRYQTGYLSEALSYWQSAWESAKDETGLEQQAVANRAIGELLLLNAKVGRTDQLKIYLAEIGNRNIQGSTETQVRAAKEGLWRMENQPQIAFKCGPFAVNSIANAGNKVMGRSATVEGAHSTKQGTNLVQVNGWARQVGLNYQMAKRQNGAPFLVPSVMHWRLDHFAALMAEKDGKYLIKDPTFGGGELWISAQALEAETDGYFLVPNGTLPSGWQSVSDEEGQNVWGKGGASSRDDNNKNKKKTDCPPVGMTISSAYEMQATLTLGDIPVRYSPPVGPDMNFEVTYNHLETNQPANFTFSNFGADWNFNWLSYVTVDASNNVQVMLGGGSTETYNYSAYDNVHNVYAPDYYSNAILSVVSPGVYQRQLPDGTVQVFNLADGTGRIFMTQVIDPQGNAAVISYDSHYRITGIVDAINQQTRVSYVSETIGNAGYYKIKQITDPFGRSANFTYDATSTYLLSITDIIGITSQFTYDTGSFINSLTTPYGKTLFYQYTPAGIGTARGLKFTFADNSQSVIENWMEPDGTPDGVNSYYWDRKAMSMYPADYLNRVYTHCKITDWLLDPAGNVESSSIGWIKLPLEGKVSYAYPDEPAGYQPPGEPHQLYYRGSSDHPQSITRTLDDNSTQTYTTQYNALGYLTQLTDPLGRSFAYQYAPNGMDLLEIRQTKGGSNDLLGKWQYNSQHRPVLHIDGSGQRTQYTYNSRGQLTTLTDAKGNVTTLTYNGNGYLTQIDGPLSGSNDVTIFTYDGYGRVWTVTDSEGYVLTYDYDAMDRVTKLTYPDGSYEQISYDKLDPVFYRDRLGRWTRRAYDQLRQLSMETDPQGHSTQYSWCTCGSLAELIDANGNSTLWNRDLQGRATQKFYQDGTSLTYAYETNTSRLKSVTDALGQVKNYTYNLDDSLAQVSYTNTVNSTSTVTYSYDSNYPRVTSVQNGWGTINYTYNAYITDPYGTPVTGAGRLQTEGNIGYSYDELGRVTARSIGGSADSSWSYDAMGRVTGITNLLGAFTYSYVDPTYGTTRLSSISYPNGQAANFSYYGNNGDQRLQQIQNLNPSSATLSQFNYVYNAAGEITQWTRQADSGTPQRLDLSYDNASQLIGAVDNNTSTGALIHQYAYSYDRVGNHTDHQSDTTVMHYTYNNVNQLTNSFGGGQVQVQGTISEPGYVTVNGKSALMLSGTAFSTNIILPVGTNPVAVQATDGSGNSTTNNYQVTVGSPGNERLSYFNFENSNLSGDKGQLPVTASGINRVPSTDGYGVEITATNSSALTYHMTESNGVSNINIGQGSMSFTFKPYWSSANQGGSGPGDASRFLQVGHYNTDSSFPFFSLLIDYDGNTIIGSVISGTSSYATVQAPISFQQGQTYNITYTWDSSSTQLYVGGTLAASGAGINPVPVFSSSATLSLGWDDYYLGQRINGVLDDVQIFNYKLSPTTVAGLALPANLQPVYDANGNLTADGKGTSYAWDAENRLIKITYASGATSNFSYDGLSRRVGIVEKNSGGTVTSTKNLLWAGTEIVQELDASSTITKHYYPQGMQLVSSGTGTNYYYSKDHLGSIREVTDSSGTVQARYDYDPYGNTAKVSGSIDSDFQYAGYYYHVPSKLNLTLFRAYDPGTARWISRDPIEEDGGINLYGYVENNVLNYIDPLGLASFGMPSNWQNLPCNDLANLAQQLADVVDQRYQDLKNDKNDLYRTRPSGQNSWKGHIDAYNNAQTQLKKVIDQMKKNGCGDKVPSKANAMAKQLAPSAPDPKTNNNTSSIPVLSPTPTQSAEAGVVVAAITAAVTSAWVWFNAF